MHGGEKNNNDPQDDSECFKNFFLKPNDPHSIDGVNKLSNYSNFVVRKKPPDLRMASLFLAYR